jgi:DNA modification methylase
MIEQAELDDAAGKLATVSWDFRDVRTNTGPHKIHPYPARFIPQIPRNLIELFHPGDDSPVLDPFCGSGTTLVEASFHGIPSIGIDLHPLAILIAKVKTTQLKKSLLRAAEVVSDKALQRIASGNLEIPAIPRLDHWFKPYVQVALAAIMQEIERVSDVDLSDAMKIAFSSIVVRVSNQDSDTRYAAVEKKLSQEVVFEGFQKAVSGIERAVGTLEGDLFTSAARVKLIHKDIMQVTPEEVGDDIGFVITSPPYPNAYEYWLYHKYRMYWLGMDPIAVRNSEIGARPHYFKKNHQTEHDFERQMGQCFWLLSRVMRPGAHACFVVGRSIIHGREIDNELLLERAAVPHGFRKIASVQRNIAVNKKSFNLSHGTINREGIVVFALGQK